MKSISTITEIADQLNIPRTTLNEWKQQYEEYLPSVGEGRSKRYIVPEALEVFKLIAQLKPTHAPEDIIRELNRQFPLNIAEVVQQQVDDPVQFNHVMNNLVSELQKANELKEKELEIRKLEIQEQEKFRNEVRDRLDRRSEEVTNLLVALRESREESAAASSKTTKHKWWPFKN